MLRCVNMQLTIEPTAAQFPAVVAAMHDDRIDRYLPAAEQSKEDAFKLFLWNCALCEAFYLPLHIAEISVRNAIHQRLSERLNAFKHAAEKQKKVSITPYLFHDMYQIIDH